MDATTQIGFIGLGHMGAPMAERLFAEDVTLHVHDLSDDALAAFVDRGAVAHGSPRAVADAAQIVLACLPNRAVSEAVAFGHDGVAEGRAVRVYVEMSTIGKSCVEGIAARLAERGIAVVDGPISGGPPAARAGRLAMMAAGPAEAVATASPWLGRIGQSVSVMGDRAGQAQIMKLVNNLVMASNVIAVCEGLVMGAKAGLDPDLMAEVIGAGTGNSRALTDIVAPTALPGRFDFGAHLSILAKDCQLGVDEADALGVPVPVIDAARSTWLAAMQDGMGDEDFTRIVELIERRGGADVRSRRPDPDGAGGGD